MDAPTPKASGALKTIGEVSAETGLPHHVLRYWETRFPQLRPLTRAGNRRYYRTDDVLLVRRIDALLNQQGYTIRGVQQLLVAEKKGGIKPVEVAGSPDAAPPPNAAAAAPSDDLGVPDALRAIRAMLADALDEDSTPTTT
ncbi:MerR family transcriptional regulator [Sphingomonas sp. Leaf343]|uniref:MerR family transcriptional regulator n=1 Tax=Sphingomonas sp. Leaf343 TaxID=1736345 RepID=UPI0006F37037|nr:MerR family transcriptional regulator [Sphingomonas sp. Leaf343]KQR87800.1 MerR family transcriptional regulator [Sphingomonas sp. Leaf343]